MPIFEYVCEKCETVFEVLQRTETPEVCCTSCGSAKTNKIYSTFTPKSARQSVPPCNEGICPSAGAGCTGGECPF